MSKHKNLGEFEIMVLAALIRLGDDAYGVAVRKEIETRAGREVTIGALYATLSRLEDKGYVATRQGEATPERGGRAKRYYRLTALGQTQFHRSVAMLETMLRGIAPWPEAP